MVSCRGRTVVGDVLLRLCGVDDEKEPCVGVDERFGKLFGDLEIFLSRCHAERCFKVLSEDFFKEGAVPESQP